MELNTRTAKKALGIEYTLCSNGVINVRSDLGSGDVHTVHLDDTGSVERCTCKGYKHTGHCYHVDAIEQNGSLRSAARACKDRKTVVTDGGTEDDDRFLPPEHPDHIPEDEIEDDDEDDSGSNAGLGTVTGWEASTNQHEDEEVDTTPL